MKKVFRDSFVLGGLSLGLLLYVAGTSTTSAILPPTGNLVPGGSVVPADGPEPVGGVVLDTATVDYVGADIQGKVISTVYQGDLDNLLGGLTFTYEILSLPASVQDISRFSVGNYGGFETDVSHNSAAVAGVAPIVATRSTGIGDIVRFDFAGIGPGQNSTLLVVQTDSQDYAPTIASVINAGSAEVLSFAPTAVPEPATFALLGLGSMALVMARKRRAA